MTKIDNAISYVKKYFSAGHERSLEAKKNIAAMFVIKGISILISLLIVPLTINYVNPTKYGIWITLSSMITWFSFFDIGFGNGLRNKFAEAKAKGHYKLAKIYVSTTYVLLGIIFLCVWLLFFITHFFVNWSLVLNAPSELGNELSKLALIVITFFCLQIVLKLLNIILIANQKPAKAAVFDTLGQVISLIIIIILTKTTSGSLTYLGMALGFSPIFVLFVSSILLYRGEYKKFSPSFAHVRFKYSKELIKIGVKFFVIQIAAIIIYQTSNIIIAQVCGPESVTTYNIAFKYFTVITMVFGIVISPFWSAYTDAYSKGDWTWMRHILNRLKQFWLVLTVITILLLIFSGFAYKIWIGKIINVPISVSIVMAIYVIINTWNGLHSQLLNGMGKIKLQLYSAVLSSLLNIPLAIFLGKKYGIAGVTSSIIILSIFSAVWSPIQIKLLHNRSAKGIWDE